MDVTFCCTNYTVTRVDIATWGTLYWKHMEHDGHSTRVSIVVVPSHSYPLLLLLLLLRSINEPIIAITNQIVGHPIVRQRFPAFFRAPTTRFESIPIRNRMLIQLGSPTICLCDQNTASGRPMNDSKCTRPPFNQLHQIV